MGGIPGFPKPTGIILYAIQSVDAARRRFSRHPYCFGMSGHLLPGSLYLTRQYRAFPEKAGIHILPESLYSGNASASVVRHISGNCWHAWGNRMHGRLLLLGPAALFCAWL